MNDFLKSMLLPNTLWRRRFEILIIGLSMLAIVPSFPILRSGTEGVFYKMDPEMAIIGNALSFTSQKVITYSDHPGTPLILLISWSFLPLRLMSKYILDINFIQWSFDNLRYLMLYVRYEMIILFLASILIYLFSIFKITKNISLVLFAFLSLFSFSFVHTLGGAVWSEDFSFFIIAIWLWLFTYILKSFNPVSYILISIVSGLAIGSKYNNFPILLITILLVFFIKEFSLIQKLLNASLGAIFSLSGFYLGTFPIDNVYVSLFRHVIKIFFLSGNESAHGSSSTTFFNLNSYLESVGKLFLWEKGPFILFLILLLFTLFFIVFQHKKDFKVNPVIILSSLVVLLSIIFIFKYSENYYQFPNFILAIFLITQYLSRFRISMCIILCATILPFTITTTSKSGDVLTTNINNSNYIEKYIQGYSTTKYSLWDYAPTEDFMRLWIREWSPGTFSTLLETQRPDLIELKADYKTVAVSDFEYKNIFSVCWDRLYIREVRALEFLKIHSSRKFEYKPINQTGIWEIYSNHCSTKL